MLIKLSNGLEIEMEKDAFNDMRVFELLSDDNPLAYPKLINMVMGKDQKQKIYDFISKESNGRVPIEKFKPIFDEIMIKMGEQDKEVKN